MMADIERINILFKIKNTNKQPASNSNNRRE
jgi:hypothetical protein